MFQGELKLSVHLGSAQICYMKYSLDDEIQYGCSVRIERVSTLNLCFVVISLKAR